MVIGGAGERGAGGLHVADVADGDAAAAGIEDGDSLGGGVAELGEHAVGGRGWAGRDCIELSSTASMAGSPVIVPVGNGSSLK